jgi:hypothetical protein
MSIYICLFWCITSCAVYFTAFGFGNLNGKCANATSTICYLQDKQWNVLYNSSERNELVEKEVLIKLFNIQYDI